MLSSLTYLFNSSFVNCENVMKINITVGKVPIKSGFTPPSKGRVKQDTMLSNPNHDWSQQMRRGPRDMGFNKSYFTLGGIQSCPYSFFRNDKLDTEIDNIKYWNPGKYNMPKGESIIGRKGEGSKDWDSTDYNMKMVHEAKRFIRLHKKKKPNDPFFAYVALGGVHLPHSPPREYSDGSPIAGVYPTPHMDLLGEMDKVIGSLMTYLKRTGLFGDTIVIFTSDNGGLGDKGEGESEQNGHVSNGPLRGHKGTIYEGGHNVPMTIRWKDHLPKGQTRSHLIGINDLYSTICDLAGVQVPPGQAQDSVSFAEYIFDESNVNGLREYLGTWRHNSKKGLLSHALRKNKWKLIHFPQTDEFELYDLENDKSESKNLASSNSQLVQEMYQYLKSIGP